MAESSNVMAWASHLRYCCQHHVPILVRDMITQHAKKHGFLKLTP